MRMHGRQADSCSHPTREMPMKLVDILGDPGRRPQQGWSMHTSGPCCVLSHPTPFPATKLYS